MRLKRIFRLLWVATVLVGLAVSLPAAAEKLRFGVEGAGSPAFPAGAYIESKGNQFRNGTGFNARASLILGSWFFGYEYTALTNKEVCSTGCSSGDYGTTKLHSFTANYHFYFIDRPVRPYILIGVGGLFGTLGAWPTQGQASNLFGMDLRAGLGLEIPIGGHVFVSIEGRYRYLLTNNPMQDLQQEVIGTLFTGGTTSDIFRESIQDAHLIQAILGIGFHF
jgi:hypothetical protein